MKGPKPLRVWGGRLVTNRWPKLIEARDIRVIVKAGSQAEAQRMLAGVTFALTRHEWDHFFCETGNVTEVGLCDGDARQVWLYSRDAGRAVRLLHEHLDRDKADSILRR